MKKLSWIFLIIILSSSVYAMDVSLVTGTKIGDDVFHDFGNTVLTVSPETSYSLNNKHTQVLSIKNEGLQDLYYFLDPYFNNNLVDINVQKIDYIIKQTSPVQTCYENNITHEQVCNTPKIETYYEPSYTLLNAPTLRNWGDDKHYVITSGILIKAGSTQDFLIKYTTADNKGKWNARIWSDYINDWTCVLDDKKTCIGDYTIDPSYDLSNLSINMTSYYKMDEGTGSNVDDSNTTNNNDLTLGAGSGWTTSGLIINATTYTRAATSYARDTSATGLPTTIGWANVWLYPTGSLQSADNPYIFEISDGTTNNRIAYAFAVTTGDLIAYTIISGTPVNIITCPWANHNVRTNIWSMVTFHWNTVSDDYNIYVNGTNVTGCTRTASGNPSAYTNLYLANFVSPAATQAYVGRMDEFGLWARNRPTSDELAGLYNNGTGCSYPFNCWVTDNYTVTLENTTWSSPMNETVNNNINVNFTWGWNVTNVSDVQLNIFNYTFNADLDTNTSNYSRWAVRDIRPPLVIYNNTNLTFNWTYTAYYDNGTNTTFNSSSYPFSVIHAYYPTSVGSVCGLTFCGNYTETSSLNWNITYQKNGNETNVTLNYITIYNTTIINLNNTISNTSNTFIGGFERTLPFVTNTYETIPIIPSINITFNGTTLTRNLTGLNFSQNIHKMILNMNCSSPATTQTINFSILELNGTPVISNLTASFDVYITNSSLSRTYDFNITNNASPFLCMYPDFENLTLDWYLNYSSGNRSDNDTRTDFNITNVSQIVYLYYTDKYNMLFFNETSGSLFDISVLSDIELRVYCTNSTEITPITSSNTTVDIECTDWNFFRLFITQNNSTYYRNLKPDYVPSESASPIEWFLIDLNVETAVQKTFYLNDLAGTYGSGDILVYKIINNTQELLHEEAWDIEKKTMVFFIYNDLYIMTLKDNNGGTRTLGNFLADAQATHTITVPLISILADQTIDDFEWQYLYNENEGWLYMAFQSLNGTPYNTSYLILNLTNQSQVFLNLSFDTNTSGSVNYTGLINGTRYLTKLTFNHSSFSVHVDTKVWGIFVLFDDYASVFSDPAGFKKWFAFITITIATLGFSGLTVSAGAICFTVLAWFFHVLGWLDLSFGGVPGSLILGIMTLVCIGILMTFEGVR